MPPSSSSSSDLLSPRYEQFRRSHPDGILADCSFNFSWGLCEEWFLRLGVHFTLSVVDWVLYERAGMLDGPGQAAFVDAFVDRVVVPAMWGTWPSKSEPPGGGGEPRFAVSLVNGSGMPDEETRFIDDPDFRFCMARMNYSGWERDGCTVRVTRLDLYADEVDAEYVADPTSRLRNFRAEREDRRRQQREQQGRQS